MYDSMYSRFFANFIGFPLVASKAGASATRSGVGPPATERGAQLEARTHRAMRLEPAGGMRDSSKGVKRMAVAAYISKARASADRGGAAPPGTRSTAPTRTAARRGQNHPFLRQKSAAASAVP